MPTSKTFGELIADLRHEHGISVYALAQRTGLSDQAIHDLEQANRQPSLETARRLAGALGVSVGWFTDRLPPVDLPTPTPGRPRGRPKKDAAPPATPPAADLIEQKRPHQRQPGEVLAADVMPKGKGRKRKASGT